MENLKRLEEESDFNEQELGELILSITRRSNSIKDIIEEYARILKEHKAEERPIQPTYIDSHGTLRFRENKIVDLLLTTGKYDLNDIAKMDFSSADREQFAQLIGYSVCGFLELSYVTDATYRQVEKLLDEQTNES